MKDLRKRMAMSSLSIGLVALFLTFAFHHWFQYVVAFSIAFMTCVAIWEFEKFAKAKGGQMILPVLLSCTFLEVLSFFGAAQSPFFKSFPLLVFFVAFLILFALHFSEKDGAVVDIAVSSFGLLYIAVPMGMILGILYFMGGQDGRCWVAYLLVVTKITDVGAYFAGSLWGRRKLAPTISPKKTVEGAVFGLLCAVIASFGFHLLSESIGAHRFYLGTVEWISLGLVLGITGQFGDLSESLLKRDANKKDSNALPGLGGILDAVDSLLFNTPIFYLYLNFVKL